MCNVNLETGIAYGVIDSDTLDSDIFDTLLNKGNNLSEEEFLSEAKTDAAEEAQEEARHHGYGDDWIKTRTEELFNEKSEGIEIQEPHIEGEYEGVNYQISWLGGHPLVFITHSPYLIRANPCGPCVKGAGDLDDIHSEGLECYDVAPGWVSV